MWVTEQGEGLGGTHSPGLNGQHRLYQMWSWHTPVIPALWRWRQAEWQSKAVPGYGLEPELVILLSSTSRTRRIEAANQTAGPSVLGPTLETLTLPTPGFIL